MKNGLMALLLVLGFSSAASANNDFGVVVGVRSDSADADVAGTSISSQTDWQLGGIGKFDVAEKLQIRSGFVYLQRSYDYKPGGGAADSTLKFTYFQIPVNLLWKFTDYGGAFIGPALDLNVSKDCGNFTCSDVKNVLVPIQLGASFKFAPQLGVEFYYEMVSGPMAEGVSNPKAVAANLMFTFD